MTCIIGLIHKNEIWMGGDSAGVAGLDIRIRKDPKVFSVANKFLIGYTSSFRMGQLLRFGFNPPEQTSTVSDYEYMCTNFIDTVRERLKSGGYAKIKENEESGGNFLVGYKGNLYEIEDDFQVGICADDFNSVGCGSKYALGSLLSTKNVDDPNQRIIQALEVAEYFSGGVRRPFVIETLKKGASNV